MLGEESKLSRKSQSVARAAIKSPVKAAEEEPPVTSYKNTLENAAERNIFDRYPEKPERVKPNHGYIYDYIPEKPKPPIAT